MFARFDRRSVLTVLSVLSVLLLPAAGALPAAAQCDTAPPAVTSFTLSPTSVNTTGAAQTVTCTVGLTDSPAGVAEVDCALQWTDGVSKFQSQFCSSTTPISGTPQSGTWRCTITLPRYSAQGIWDAQVTATDAVTNTKTFISFELPPGTTSVNVTSDPDLIAPALTSSTLNPTSVNVSAADQNTTCTMNVTDAKSGVQSAFCLVTGPTPPPPAEAQAQGCVDDAPNSGTRQNGTFSCTIKIPRYSDAGLWTTQVLLIDAVGNSAPLTATPTLTVTSSPEDLAGPVVGAFDFNPKTANAATGPTTVTCTIPITDSPAGVAAAGCTFSFTNFLVFPPIQQTQGCSSATPSSGTPNSGTYTCQVVIPRYSAPGNWTVSVDVEDKVGNLTTTDPVTPLNVTCGGAGDPEAVIRFQQGTRNTIIWSAISGATRYNAYKGNLPQLPGPPVNYGTCQNATDPNLTDTQFIDNAIPSATQKGFHYLVSYTSGGVEKGLGKQSNGTARTVSPPCP